MYPGMDDLVFTEWWRQALQQVAKQYHKVSTLVILVVWWTWKHRNGYVFKGTSPNVNRNMQYGVGRGQR
jgi:hypothetical protein